MKMIFRNSDSLYEIVNIIQRSEAQRSFVWQNKSGKRRVYEISRLVYNEDLHLVQFQLKNYDFSILVDEVLYIKLSYNESLFKGEVVSIEQNLVSVYLPQELKTLELRQHTRSIFLPKDEKKVTFEIAPEITSDRAHTMAFTTLDISLGGISVIVSDNNKQLVETSGKHLLVALGPHALEEPIIMDLRYGQTLRYRIRGKTYMANRFGFKFLSRINPAMVDMFIRGK